MSRKEGHEAEENVSIVRKILKCEISISAASQEVGVGRKTIRRWMARYEAEGAAGFLPREQNRVYLPETKQMRLRTIWQEEAVCWRSVKNTNYEMRGSCTIG